MSFINTYCFKTEIPRAALLDFIARTPIEIYCFVLTTGNDIYGMFVSDEVIEFFTNEFPVHSIEIVPERELRNLLRQKECKVWGSRELLVSAMDDEFKAKGKEAGNSGEK